VEEATRFNQTVCPLGHYCDKGIVIECPAGRYGGTLGLYDSGCSGPCDAGYYCPSASVIKTQVCAPRAPVSHQLSTYGVRVASLNDDCEGKVSGGPLWVSTP
jgi:hypothetical protein